MTKRSPRTDQIASLVLSSDATDADIAARYGVSRQRVQEIRRAAGVTRKAGRPPSGAVTHRTARGQALLARVVEAAEAAGVEPEAWVDRAIVMRRG